MTPEQVEIAAADLNDAAQTLDIRWADGHASVYPLKYLRGECPCAACRTTREEARSNPFRVIGPNERPPVPVITDIQPMGRYGMQIFWQDGHSTGIYTFEYLREICPCDACRAARKAETPYVHGIYIPGSG
jgi:DUF971 family protein